MRSFVTTHLFLSLFFARSLAPLHGEATSEKRFIDSISDIYDLTPVEIEKGIRAELDAQITFYQPSRDRLFITDETGGTFLNPIPPTANLRQGQPVRISGVIRPGQPTPFIQVETLESTAPPRNLPKPKLTRGREKKQTNLNWQWMAIRTVPVKAKVQESGINLKCVSGDRLLDANLYGDIMPEEIDAILQKQVLLTGIGHSSTNKANEALLTLEIPSVSNIDILSEKLTTASATDNSIEEAKQRHLNQIEEIYIFELSGLVQNQPSGNRFRLLDQTDSLECIDTTSTTIQLGDFITAKGFLSTIGTNTSFQALHLSTSTPDSPEPTKSRSAPKDINLAGKLLTIDTSQGHADMLILVDKRIYSITAGFSSIDDILPNLQAGDQIMSSARVLEAPERRPTNDKAIIYGVIPPTSKVTLHGAHQSKEKSLAIMKLLAATVVVSAFFGTLLMYFKRPIRAFIAQYGVPSNVEINDGLMDLYQQTQGIVYTLDLEGQIQTCNQAFADLLGYKKDSLLLKNFKDLLRPDQQALVQKMIDRKLTLLSPSATSYEIDMKKADGSTLTIEINNRLLFDGEKPKAVLGLGRDVTDQRRRESEVRRRFEFEKLITSISKDFINLSVHSFETGISHALGKIGDYEKVDRAYVILFGPTNSEIDELVEWCAPGIEPKRHLYDKFSVAVLPWFLKQMQRFQVCEVPDVSDLPREASTEQEEWTAHQVQSLICIPLVSHNRLNGFLRFDSVKTKKTWSPDTLRLLRIMVDILANTIERRRTEKELEQSRIEAEAANRAKSNFLATVSHEIRTPMNGIIGMTELLERTSLTGRQADLTDTIHSSSEVLLDIINEILDFSKIESGLLEMESLGFELVDLIEGTIDLLSPKAQAKHLEINAAIHPTVPTSLIGDPGRLRQIIMNLVGNAVKFTDEGEASIEVRLANEISDQDEFVQLLFSIRDTGIGIDPSIRSKLFEPFMQADSSMTRRFGGTGLGLAISQQLVKLMNGDIGAESNRGRGSRFWFTAEFGINPSTQETAHPEKVGQPTHIKHALVLTERKRSISLFDGHLSRMGIQFESSSSLTQALDKLIQTADADPYDAIIVDSPANHQEMLAKINRTIENASCPPPSLCLFVSANTDQASPIPDFIPGMRVGYLGTPIKESQLRRLLSSQAAMDEGSLALKDAVPRTGGRADDDPPSMNNADVTTLIAEDNSVNRAVLIDQLRFLGIEPAIARNGKEALEKAREGEFDLIFMDCQMPVMDGYEATKNIRALEKTSSMKTRSRIVALTAHAMPSDREKCLKAGMDDYIAKPLRSDDIRSIVKRLKSSDPLPPPPNQSLTAEQALLSTTINWDILEEIRELASPRNPDPVGTLLGLFKEDFPAKLTNLEASIANNQRNDINQNAHSLKGIAASIGASHLSKLAETMENSSQSASKESLRELYASLEQELQIVLEELEVRSDLTSST